LMTIALDAGAEDFKSDEKNYEIIYRGGGF